MSGTRNAGPAASGDKTQGTAAPIATVALALAFSFTSHAASSEVMTFNNGLLCSSAAGVRDFLTGSGMPDECGIYDGSPVPLLATPLETVETPEGKLVIYEFDPVQDGLLTKFGYAALLPERTRL